jgi:RNA polymerase sigma-70 factor (ECF subfamily)
LEKQNTNNILVQDQENELIDKLLINDNEAFDRLVRDYSSKMYVLARRLLPNDDDAQECIQKTFIQVFNKIHTFRRDASLATWLHRITVNCALMILRAQKKRKTVSLDEFTQHYNEYGERTSFSDNEGNNLEHFYERQETQTSINEVIRSLPEKYCNVIQLRDIQELSTRDTAEFLDISEASVKTQLHRGRQLLKAILEQQTN